LEKSRVELDSGERRCCSTGDDWCDALCEAFSPHGDMLSSTGDDWWEKTPVDALCEAFLPHGDMLSSPGDDWWEKTGEHLPFSLTVGNLGEHGENQGIRSV
jgi:hypothetical protein